MDRVSENPFDTEYFEREFKVLLYNKTAVQRVQNSSIHNSATPEEKAQASEREKKIDRKMIEFVAQSMSQVDKEGRRAIVEIVESIWYSSRTGNIIGILSTF